MQDSSFRYLKLIPKMLPSRPCGFSYNGGASAIGSPLHTALFKQIMTPLIFSLLLASTCFVLALAQGCAPLPAQLPAPSDLPIISTLPDPFTFRLSNRTVASHADWECRRAELKTLVQEYLWGYFPDRTAETVHAAREGNNITVTVSANDKTASFVANITFPSTLHAHPNPPSSSSEAAEDDVGPGLGHAQIPVIIAAGTVLAPVNITPFLESGAAVVQFDVNAVGNDSWTRVGAFWDLYPDRDIGEPPCMCTRRHLRSGPICPPLTHRWLASQG